MTTPEAVLFAVVALMALVLVIGARRRWRWLADPPTFPWPVYPYAFVKRHFGTKAVIWVLYVNGIALLLILSYVFVLLYR